MPEKELFNFYVVCKGKNAYNRIFERIEKQ